MGLWQDVRFAARLLVKDKWFTLVAVIALALGIGVNNTVFTFVNAVLIRALAFNGNTFNVSDEGRAPERFSGAFVSANMFKLIGQHPFLGRDFLPEDDRPGALPVVLLGHGVWKNRYGSDRSILGRPIKLNELPSVVIGVMP